MVGPLCNFYPMLNVSSVPVITITLRNNLMQVVPIKQWLSKSENKIAKFMIQVRINPLNHNRTTKKLLKEYGVS